MNRRRTRSAHMSGCWFELSRIWPEGSALHDDCTRRGRDWLFGRQPRAIVDEPHKSLVLTKWQEASRTGRLPEELRTDEQ